MIQGINNQTPQNPYGQGNRKNQKTDDKAPVFLLNYDENGVVWERNDTQKTEKKKETLSPLEGKEEPIKNRKTEEATEDGDFAKQLKEIWQSIKGFFQKLLHTFWYEEDKTEENTKDKLSDEIPQKNEKLSGTVTTEEQEKKAENVERAMSEEEKDKKIRELLKKKDTEGVMQILTDNNRLRLAHNSSLLTYYDRYGKMVSIPISDRERILHGDGGKKSYQEKL